MEFKHMIEELKSTTSKTEKERILKYYLLDEEYGEYFKILLQETFDPNLLHHVVMKRKELPSVGMYDLGEVKDEVLSLFNRLHNELSPAKNKADVLEVMTSITREDQEILMGVVNKKLQCGISIATINKVLPGTIEVIKIALAKSYNPSTPEKYCNKLYCSNKLDGQRVISVRTSEGWNKHSRAGDYLGNKITTLDHWDDDLNKYYEKTGLNFLDGEAYKHGMEFGDITSLIKSTVNKKDATQLEYHIFFAGKARDIAEASRKNHIRGVPPEALYEMFRKYRYLVGVPQKKILNDEITIYNEIDKAVAVGYEGVMLRSTKVPYDFKRGNHLVKAKKSALSGTVEYTDAYVEDIEYGEMVVRENGTEEIENLPVALWVVLPQDESTTQMKIGSGFSLQDRRDWAKDESAIMGQMVEVEYQGMGARGRMRFPRYLRTRTDLQ